MWGTPSVAGHGIVVSYDPHPYVPDIHTHVYRSYDGICIHGPRQIMRPPMYARCMGAEGLARIFGGLPSSGLVGAARTQIW